MKIQVLNRYPHRPMLMRSWQPFHEIEAMRRQFNSLFNDLTVAGEEQTAWTPAIELKDSGDVLLLRAQLPGLDAKDVDIHVSKGAVAISGERRSEQQSEQGGAMRSEFRYGKFQRVISLPVAVQNDQVQAEYKDGILSLTLPKVAEARNKVVKLNLAELNQAAEPEATEATDSNR